MNVESGGDIGGQLNSIEMGTTNRYFARWDLPGLANSDFEQIFQAKQTSGSVGLTPFWRASGSSGTENGYAIYWAGTTVHFGYLFNGGWFDLSSTSLTLTLGDWYRVRSQFNGSNLKVKIWKKGDAEPGSWTFEVTNSKFASGWVGFQEYLGVTKLDYIAISSLIDDPQLVFPTTTTTV